MQKGWCQIKCTYQSSTTEAQMNTEKKRLLKNAFFCHNLIIVSLHGCSTIGR